MCLKQAGPSTGPEDTSGRGLPTLLMGGFTHLTCASCMLGLVPARRTGDAADDTEWLIRSERSVFPNTVRNPSAKVCARFASVEADVEQKTALILLILGISIKGLLLVYCIYFSSMRRRAHIDA